MEQLLFFPYPINLAKKGGKKASSWSVKTPKISEWSSFINTFWNLLPCSFSKIFRLFGPVLVELGDQKYQNLLKNLQIKNKVKILYVGALIP